MAEREPPDGNGPALWTVTVTDPAGRSRTGQYGINPDVPATPRLIADDIAQVARPLAFDLANAGDPPHGLLEHSEETPRRPHDHPQSPQYQRRAIDGRERV